MRHITTGLLLALAFLAAACATSNVIPLQYVALPDAKLSCDNRSVTVVTFADKRSTSAVGVDAEGNFYPPDRNVARWVTDALADELRGYTCQVIQSDVAHGDGMVISGEIREALVRRVSFTTYQGRMIIQMNLTRPDGSIVMKEYVAQSEVTDAPSKKVYAEMLREELQDIMSRAVPELIRAMGSAPAGQSVPNGNDEPANSNDQGWGEYNFGPAPTTP